MNDMLHRFACLFTWGCMSVKMKNDYRKNDSLGEALTISISQKPSRKQKYTHLRIIQEGLFGVKK